MMIIMGTDLYFMYLHSTSNAWNEWWFYDITSDYVVIVLAFSSNIVSNCQYVGIYIELACIMQERYERREKAAETLNYENFKH